MYIFSKPKHEKVLRLEKISLKDFPNQYITGLSPSMVLPFQKELVLVHKDYIFIYKYIYRNIN
jgi:hypothetical protein